MRVHGNHCGAYCGGPAGGEYFDANDIVLMHCGAFYKHFGRRSVTADANRAVFFSQGSTYRVSHPAICNDRGTVLAVSPRVLNDIVRDLDPSVDDRPDRPFTFVTGPCDPVGFWKHRAARSLETDGTRPVDLPQADATALELVADVLGAAFARHDFMRRRRRVGTEAARTYLESRLDSGSRSTTSPAPCMLRLATWPASTAESLSARPSVSAASD